MSKDFRNFTVSNARNADIDRFKAIQAKTPDKLAHTAFGTILNLAEGKSIEPSDLYNKYQDALQQIEALKTENAELQEKITLALNELNEAEPVMEKLKADLADLQSEISNQKSEIPAGKAFIYEPSDAQYQQMRRTISYLIKQGKLNRADTNLPQQLTYKAINYLIKNEYEHILK